MDPDLEKETLEFESSLKKGRGLAIAIALLLAMLGLAMVVGMVVGMATLIDAYIVPTVGG